MFNHNTQCLNAQGMTPSLTLQLDQTETLPAGYTVTITHAEVIHVGQSISNLLLSVGDSQNTSSSITINGSVNQWRHVYCTFLWLENFTQIVTVYLGEDILNTHDNIENSDDIVIVQVLDAYVTTEFNLSQPLNQVT